MRFSSFVEHVFLGGAFSKMDFRRRPFNQKPLVLGEIQRPIRRYFIMKLPSNLPSNVEKWTFRCHVRPNPAKVRDNVFVCSMPSSRTPPDLPNFNLNCEKNSFCEKLDLSVSRQFLRFFGPYRRSVAIKPLCYTGQLVHGQGTISANAAPHPAGIWAPAIPALCWS